MAMVKCPYCNNEVDEKYQDKECPFCGKYVKSSDWLKAQVRSYIWKFKKNGGYDQIKALVQTGDVTEATKVIRTVVGRQDTVVEKLVISDMLTTKIENQYEAGDSEVEESADSEGFMTKRVDSFIRLCNRRNALEQLRVCIWNGEFAEATEQIRAILGKTDRIMEDAVITRILQDIPYDWKYTDSRSYLQTNKTVTKSVMKQTKRCLRCRATFPDDMDNCPSCGASNTDDYAVQINTKVSSNSTMRNVMLTTCTACNGRISINAESCPHCGNPTGVHICPKCGSANTKTISGASKATSIFLWGPFAANKVMSKYQCKDCWHKF